MKNNYITVIGSMNYDYILKINNMPKIGETIAAYSHTFASGGKGGNQAVQCSKLGVKTYMLGMVGNDYMGNFLLKQLNKYEVDISNIEIINEITGFSVANSLPDGNVFATIVHGSNFKVNKEYIDKLKEIIINSEVVILQMEIPIDIIEYIIEICGINNTKVVLNTAPANNISTESLKKCDFVIANELEQEFYTNIRIDNIDLAKKSVYKFYNELNTNCIFTLGKKGCIICFKGEIKFFPSIKAKAVETTGAGDSFIGGFVSSFYIFGYGIKQSVDFAQVCSAITIRNIGAQNSMPTIEDINKYVKNK